MPPVYLYHSTSAQLDAVLLPGVPLGCFAEPTYESEILPLEANNLIVLISDGLPELRDHTKGFLGYEAVEESIKRNRHQSPQEILQALIKLGEDWSGGQANEDDITLMVVKRTPLSGNLT